MKRKAYQVVFPATIVVVLLAFLSTIFFANVNLSFSASGKKESSAVAGTSAIEQTDAQEELWNNIAMLMWENAKDMDIKVRAENAKTMNAVEHMKFHSQITEAQLAQQKKFIPPFEALYASMSDEQKKITDTIFRTGKHEKHKRK